ncbi:MAG: M24 family metallopeptidase [Promethearchaeota archaeon]
MSNKLKEFQKILQNEGFNAFFVINKTNVYYFTKFLSQSVVYLMVYPESVPYLFVPELEYENALNTVKNSEIVKINRNSEILQLIKDNLKENQIKRLGIEENSMSVKFYVDLTKKCAFIELESGSKLIDNLRMIKNTDEIEKIETACRITDIGFSTALENIAEGRTEIEIAAEVEYAMRKKGSEVAPFETIIASGHRSALPHGVSSNKKIEREDFIIIDLGAKYKGYCSDMTRTVLLGKPNQKKLEIYNAVLKTQQEAIKACNTGKNVMTIEEIARKILFEEGYNNYFIHSLGHGVGLDVHELPTIALNSKDVLLENMTFTIEPGVYIPDFGGVRIEDVILLTKKGPKCLTKSEYTIEI